jgi:hypothetical protein
LFWILVLSSVLGLTNFIGGGLLGLMPAMLVIAMILLPIVAVAIAAYSRSKDDQTQIG